MTELKWQRQIHSRWLTQLIPGGEDGGPQAGVVMRVCKGREIVLQPAVSEVEHHQAATHSQQQQEEDRDHHCCHVPGMALTAGGIAGAWVRGKHRHQILQSMFLSVRPAISF